jgi:hypothetical protein
LTLFDDCAAGFVQPCVNLFQFLATLGLNAKMIEAGLPTARRWKGNADLERLVAQYMLKHDPAGEPSPTSLKEHVSRWIPEFEAGN